MNGPDTVSVFGAALSESVPMNGRTDTWITAQSDTLSTVDQTQGGIDDVHSGAQVTATDGSSYNTW